MQLSLPLNIDSLLHQYQCKYEQVNWVEIPLMSLINVTQGNEVTATQGALRVALRPRHCHQAHHVPVAFSIKHAPEIIVS